MELEEKGGKGKEEVYFLDWVTAVSSSRQFGKLDLFFFFFNFYFFIFFIIEENQNWTL